MNFGGAHRVDAPGPWVYEKLNDPSVLQRCIPGCERMEKTGEDEYRAHMKMGLAAIKGSFVGSVRVSDRKPFHSYRLHIEGKGAPGFVKGSALIELAETGGGTDLKFTAEAQVGGLIASVGSRLIEAAAKKIAAEFFDRFGRIAAEQR